MPKSAITKGLQPISNASKKAVEEMVAINLA